jgi:Flp pilus assembly protein TadG
MKTNKLRKLLREEEGTAIIEFVIYALPLFVPLIIYLTSINQSAQIQYEARNFARQLARAYVTSPSQEFTGARILAVKEVFTTSSFATNKIDLNPKIEITCSLSPCLTPTGKVSVTVHLTSIFSGTSANATAIQTVDAWRSG